MNISPRPGDPRTGENEDWSWHRERAYTPVVNVSGTMTSEPSR